MFSYGQNVMRQRAWEQDLHTICTAS